MTDPRFRYILIRHNLNGGNQTVISSCEVCQRKIVVELAPNSIRKVKGTFHHKDGDSSNNCPENFWLVCYECHERLHDLGVIQRWAKKIGRKLEDLPDCTMLKPIWKRKW